MAGDVGALMLGPGLLVSNPLALSDAPGGAQICTQEYVRTLRAAGIDLTFEAVPHDRRIATRILRRLRQILENRFVPRFCAAFSPSA